MANSKDTNSLKYHSTQNGLNAAAADGGFHFPSHKKHPESPPFAFLPKRALIVSKMSLLEYEFDRRRSKRHFANFEDPQFLRELERQHINVADLRQRHELQQQYLATITRELQRHDIAWRVVHRRDYSDLLVQWADLIISAGGDGTFLTAAKRVTDGTKPVVGINTDPVGSEGFLCLTGKSRRPADEVIRQFLEEGVRPNFHWMRRQRIRVTVLKEGTNGGDVSASSSSSSIREQNKELQSTDADRPADRKDSVAEVSAAHQSDDDDSMMSRKSKFSSDDEDDQQGGQQPAHRLALNEVFIGESHAARVSYYDVQVDNGPMTKQKSSGMTICTGTGSTSWHYNINRLTDQNLCEIFAVMGQMGLQLDSEVSGEMVEEICRRFNDKLKFGAELQMMAFSVRDPVFNATFPKTLIRGFANKILLKSRCMHAHLILDGSTSIPFNRGTEVLLEIHPEDALRTAVFKAEDRS